MQGETEATKPVLRKITGLTGGDPFSGTASTTKQFCYLYEISNFPESSFYIR